MGDYGSCAQGKLVQRIGGFELDVHSETGGSYLDPRSAKISGRDTQIESGTATVISKTPACMCSKVWSGIELPSGLAAPALNEVCVS
jgi:hypothetical protein